MQLASLKFRELIRSTKTKLEELGFEVLFPNLDTNFTEKDFDVELKGRLLKEHNQAIDNCDLLYVICPDGYVGKSVMLEIGYAYAKGKKIFFSEKPEELGLQGIATEYINLDELSKIRSYV